MRRIRWRRRCWCIWRRWLERALYAILDDTIDTYFPIVHQIDEFIDGLEERVIVTFDESALRDHVLRINDALDTYRDLLSSTMDSYLT